ncbi:exocyst complex component 8 isoform X2 [Hyalella azteca]|uniref:Exocyst complex component 8 isoform X2 n=1 Tax=Hyalella azteca TaxID=294128 RepID=A0A8B7P6H2_HYAAZ|nr:exocyst complex component 8 isoform X2 [Hyalella azteca]
MADILVKKLTADDFDAEKYVQSLSHSSVGGLELQQQRQRVLQLSKETSALLKKNVYNNYMQFIETAKEISQLESEMYQLSHLITDQKSILSMMLEVTISGDKGPGSGLSGVQEAVQEFEDPQEARLRQQRENRKKLSALLENIEGCSHVLEEPERWLVYEGDLVELSQDDYSGQQRVRACLLNDSFMLATWLADRRGPVRYRFETLHLLDALVPVNVKDRGQATNAFKLLIFPDARAFQAPSPKIKSEWLEHLERTKKDRVAAQQKQPTAEHRAPVANPDSENPFLKQQDSVGSRDSQDDDETNPFSWWSSSSAPPQSQVPQTPEWMQELPEDLDQAIAQRNFEDALTLIQRAREYFTQAPKTLVNAEMKRGVETRVKTLVSVVRAELAASGERSLNAGPKAARRAVNILLQLNKQQMACELFLKYRTAILKSALQRLRLEGDTEVYIRHLCAVYFRNLNDTLNEFNKVFASCKSCLPALVVWAGDSMNSFASKFCQHVFSTQSSLTTVSECVSLADHYCKQASKTGLDLRFALHASMSRDLERRVASARDQMLDAIKLRAQDESWQPTKFTDERQLQTFMEEMNDIGVAGLNEYLTDALVLGLTSSVLELVRVMVAFVEDVLRLLVVWPDAQQLLADSLTAVLEAQLHQCKAAVQHPMLKDKVSSCLCDAQR